MVDVVVDDDDDDGEEYPKMRMQPIRMHISHTLSMIKQKTVQSENPMLIHCLFYSNNCQYHRESDQIQNQDLRTSVLK